MDQNHREKKLQEPCYFPPLPAVEPPNFLDFFKCPPSRRHPDKYLALCSQHTKAEYSRFFITKVQEAPSSGWRDRACDVIHVEGEDRSSEFEGFVIKKARKYHGEELDTLAELKGHLVIYRESLFVCGVSCMSCHCKPQALFRYRCPLHKRDGTPLLNLVKVMSMSGYPDANSAKHPDHQSLMYSLGYCFDYFKQVSALEQMRSTLSKAVSGGGMKVNVNMKTLELLVNPRQPFRVSTQSQEGGNGIGGGSDFLNDERDVPLVPQQLDVIRALDCQLEVIQGPPGAI